MASKRKTTLEHLDLIQEKLNELRQKADEGEEVNYVIAVDYGEGFHYAAVGRSDFAIAVATQTLKGICNI